MSSVPNSSIHPQGWVPIETKLVRTFDYRKTRTVAFTPKGGCPLKRLRHLRSQTAVDNPAVAFTPKGGCPLKLYAIEEVFEDLLRVAFTPKGGCPLKRYGRLTDRSAARETVAFTPKGGCPLKRFAISRPYMRPSAFRSIHPQGWVPIETAVRARLCTLCFCVAFTPKGGCPLKPQYARASAHSASA